MKITQISTFLAAAAIAVGSVAFTIPTASAAPCDTQGLQCDACIQANLSNYRQACNSQVAQNPPDPWGPDYPPGWRHGPVEPPPTPRPAPVG